MPDTMDYLEFEDWEKAQLRVGTIKAVKAHPDADKLYILLVDLGKDDQDRQIVAGLRNHYSEEELMDKQVVVIKNLKPVKLRGVESFGMLLAAVKDDKVILVSPEREIGAGAKIQ